jgi:osmotically-inducible protein OsmY
MIKNTQTHIFKRTIVKLTLAMLTSSQLISCAPIIVGGAVSAVMLYADRRPTNIQTTDKGLQIELSSEAQRDNPSGDVEVAVWNRRVLIVGSVVNQQQKDLINQKYANHRNITHLFNELTVGFNPALLTKGSDTLLTSRVRAKLVATQGINSNSIKVVSSGSKVYLLGWPTANELEKVVYVARQTEGVTEVVNLTELVGPK